MSAASPAGELAATAERLRRLLPGFSEVYALDDAGDGRQRRPWIPVDALVRDGHLGRMLMAVRRQGGGFAYPAAAVGATLAQAVAGRLAASLARERRAFDASAANLLVLPAPQGHLAGVAVRRPMPAVLSGDPAAGHEGALVFPGLGDLLEWSARRAVGTLSPLFAAVHQSTRFGVVPLWNLTADAVLTSATLPALLARGDQLAERRVGEAFLDALVSSGARVTRRGHLQRVPAPGRSVVMPVRGSCCLVYRLTPAADIRGDGYCSTCPLVPAADRGRRLERWVRAYVPRTTPGS